MLQLEFFELDNVERVAIEMDKLKESNDRLRKALFARHGQLAKNYLDLHNRLDVIERNICKEALL